MTIPADFVRCDVLCAATGAVLGRVSLPPALARAYSRGGLFGRDSAAGALLEEFIVHHLGVEPARVVRLERGEGDDSPGPLCSAALAVIRDELRRELAAARRE